MSWCLVFDLQASEGWKWRGTVVCLAAVEVVLSGYFTFCALQAYNACYVEPCYEGPGLQELWKVPAISLV